MGGLVPMLAVVSRVDFATFWVCAVIVVVGAIGVVSARNPVHAALMLVLTLFGVAVLFVAQRANFLAAVQVIVYAGAIVVLFLFVIMFLGVDRREDLGREPLRGQRLVAPLLVLVALGCVLALGAEAHWAVGPHSVVGPARGQPGGDVAALGRAVFTVYLWPFEITAGLLVIAVVGAVVLARRPRPPLPGPEPSSAAAASSRSEGSGGGGTTRTGDDPDAARAEDTAEAGPGRAAEPAVGAAATVPATSEEVPS
jgi:NADH-quinone oxidoreductase subunit J